MRIILFAGKGGVGKTSVAAATGLELARRGYKTLVMSVDPAHSLTDAFDLDKALLDPRQGRLFQVKPNLWMQEVDVQEEIERYWDDIHRYMSALLSTSGLDEVVAEEMAIFPGMEEISCLLYVNQYLRQRRFEVILLDCAPTAESLRFISIPTTLEWYMNKIFKLERRVAKLVRPMFGSLVSVPLPEDSCFANIERLHERLRGIDRILVDPKVTTVRLVTNPEKIVLRETQRAFMYFCLYGMTIDAVIINRILPERVQDRFFDGWRNTQARYIARVEKFFDPVPIWRLPLFDDEVLGAKALERLAAALYGDRDPAEVYYAERPYQVKKVDGRYTLCMKLPFAESDEVQLYKRTDELIVRVGGYKRHVLLPLRLARHQPEKAKLQAGNLVVTFRGGDAKEKKSARSSP